MRMFCWSRGTSRRYRSRSLLPAMTMAMARAFFKFDILRSAPASLSIVVVGASSTRWSRWNCRRLSWFPPQYRALRRRFWLQWRWRWCARLSNSEKMLVRWRCFTLSSVAIGDASTKGRSRMCWRRIQLVPQMVSGATLVVFEMLFNGARSFELRGEIFRWLVPRAPPTCLG